MAPGKKPSAMRRRPDASQRDIRNQDTHLIDRHHKLRLAIDYGTKTLAVTFLITNCDDIAACNKPLDVHFDSQNAETPQQVAWSASGTFYWGRDVHSALERGDIVTEDIIQLWKLVLYKQHKDSDMVRTVTKQLRGCNKGLADLISVHLEAIILKTKDIIKGGLARLHFSAEEIDAFPVELLLSVPQLWKDPACLLMTRAAQVAGADYVELVYEPECAAGYYTDMIQAEVPAQLSKSDTLLIADIGGGTGDFVTYEYCESSDIGSQVKMRTVGKATGALCGSEYVNENFRQWLQYDALPPGSFEAHCRELGISVSACLYQASEGFEDVKVKFGGSFAPGFVIYIAGSPGGSMLVWPVKVSIDDVRSFFDPVIEEIEKCIDDSLTPRTKALIVPGGFGRSIYLQRRLEAAYSRRGIVVMAGANIAAPTTVSQGAFKRFKTIQPRGMPSTSSLGIGVVESYSADRHPDATYHRGDILPSGSRCRAETMINHRIVEIDPYSNEHIVYERWRPILSKGMSREPDREFSTETWQMYVIEPDQTTITTQIYWTELDLEPSAPILKGQNNLVSKPRNEIEHWGGPITFTLPDLQQAGFDSFSCHGKNGFYEIYVRIVLVCNGANLQAKMQLAGPDTQPFDEEGNNRSSQLEVSHARVFTLSTETHNPTVNSGVS